jgi:hypothetical protein
MTKEQLMEMLQQEEEQLKQFSHEVNAELAFRQGRIKILAELLQKEEQNEQSE